MQATVSTYEARTRTGTVLLDDGTELGFDATAFDAGGLRLLRFGQRVNIAISEVPPYRITAITLSTFPLPDPPAADAAPAPGTASEETAGEA